MSAGLFDEIRVFYGSERLKTIFNDMASSNIEETERSINHKNLKFPSLFTLKSEIASSDLLDRLNQRNRYALDLINNLSSEERLGSDRILSEYTPENYSALRWILETGYTEDGMSDDYDEVLDTAAIILTRVYNDRSCLRLIEELIFSRYRKDSFIYDLVWAYFETINTQNINLLVNRLRSANPKDVELARKFLNFIPCISLNRDEDPHTQYQCCLKWINQNQNFLYYTGATNLQTTNPCRYEVSLEAKYMQKPAYSVIGEQSRSLKREETVYLNNFRELDEESQLLLSNYSDYLYRNNKNRWNRWLQSPIDRQLEIAKRIMGGAQ